MNLRAARQALASLTPREREVLHWVCECKSDADIGGILGISVHTVSKHLQRVFKKLGVENRMAAARSAFLAASRNGALGQENASPPKGCADSRTSPLPRNSISRKSAP